MLDTGYKHTQVHSKTVQIIFTHAIFDLAERFLFLSLPVTLVSLGSQCVLNTYVHTYSINQSHIDGALTMFFTSLFPWASVVTGLDYWTN